MPPWRVRPYSCNPKVLGETPKMINSQKWLGEGAKGRLSPGSENWVAPVQNGVAPVQNGFRMVQKTLGRLFLLELKLPFAPSPNHFWEFTIFGISPRTFGLQPYSSISGPALEEFRVLRAQDLDILLALVGVGRKGLLEKGSFHSPYARDSREFRDP